MSQAPTAERTIGVGVLGVGLMGRTHTRAYQAAIRDGFAARLVALCDQDPQRLDSMGHPRGLLPGEDSGQLIDPGETHFYQDPAELIAREDIELLSICTHTDSHVELAIAALQAGKSVLLEKPVALRAEEVQRLVEAEREATGFCMPAMCMRFWPGWRWLKAAIETRRFGAVESASFRRLASRPDWAPEFYGDLRKSGGALFDLHIHDADLVQWLFGAPDSVHSFGDLNHLTTHYGFRNGPPHVSAQGGWNHTPGFPFQMHFSIIFEEASADFSSTREPALLLYQAGEARELEPEVDYATGYDGEVRHALQVCWGAQPEATLDEALRLTRMLEQEASLLHPS